MDLAAAFVAHGRELEARAMRDKSERGKRRPVPAGVLSRTGVDINAARSAAKDAVKATRERMTDWVGRPYKD